MRLGGAGAGQPGRRIDARGRGGKRDINDANRLFLTKRERPFFVEIFVIFFPMRYLNKHRCMDDLGSLLSVNQTEQPKMA